MTEPKVFATAADASEWAAAQIFQVLQADPRAVLGVATGSSPAEVYKGIVAWPQRNSLP